jgi:hypothetical protein
MGSRGSRGVIGSFAVVLALACGEGERRVEEAAREPEAPARLLANAPAAHPSTRQAGGAAPSPDGAAVATLRAPSRDEPDDPWRVVLWDVETGAETRAVPIPRGRPARIAFRSDGRRLVVTTRDGAAHGVAVVDAAEGRLLGSASTGDELALAAVFSADGRHILVSTVRGVELRDAETLAQVARAVAKSPIDDLPACEWAPIPEDLPIPDPSPPADDCATATNEAGAFLSPAGVFFVQTTRGRATHGPIRTLARQVTLFDAGTLEARCTRTLSESEFAEVLPGSFEPGDGVLRFVPDAWDGADGEFRRLDTDVCTDDPAEQEPVVMSARFVLASPAGGYTLAVGDARTAELWSAVEGRRPRVARLHALAAEHARVFGAAFSAGGERVALLDGENRLQVFETATARRLALVQVAPPSETLERVAFLPDGRRVLVAGERRPSSIAVLVDTDTGQILRRFE